MRPATKMNRGLFTSENPKYGTPRDFYQWLDAAFEFSIDVCADADNHKHDRFWTEVDDARELRWTGETAFMNPPYGDELPGFMRKARHEAIHEQALAVCLVPSRTDTGWWHRSVMSSDRDVGKLLRSYFDPIGRVLWLRWEGLITGVYHHDQRLQFEGAKAETDGAPFPSAVVIHCSTDRKIPRPGKAPRRTDLYLNGRPPLSIGAPA